MATIDTSVTYALTNAFTGPSSALTVPSRSTSLSMSELVAGAETQQWFISEFEFPFYRLHVASLGRTQSLDVINDNGINSIKLYMTDTGPYTGQFWRFDRWSSSDPGAGYRLSNNFTGLAMHLDVYSDTRQAFLAEGDSTGQHWMLNTAAASSTTSATSVTTPMTTSNPVTSSSVPSSSGTSSSTPSSGGGDSKALSIGAIAGIAIGAVAVIALIVGIIVFFAIRRKKDAQRRGRELSGGGFSGGELPGQIHEAPNFVPTSTDKKKQTYGDNSYTPAVIELDSGGLHTQRLLVELP